MKSGMIAMAAGLAGVALTATVASAGSLVLGNSGWQAIWANDNLALNTDGVTDNAVFIEKMMDFTTNDPVRILFQQIPGQTAVPYIVINDEQLVNRSGQAWSGFTMTVVGLTGNAHFDTSKSALGQPGGFAISPFTTGTFSNDDTVLTVGGGVIPSHPIGENVWFPGAGAGNLWMIDAAGSSTVPTLLAFTLTEQPIVTPIPLPAAAWSGLAGLVGLGGLGLLKKRRTA
jgi:hypothetical protein